MEEEKTTYFIVNTHTLYVVKILLNVYIVFLSCTITRYCETVFVNSRDVNVTVKPLAIVASLVVKACRFFSFRMFGIFPIGNEIFLYLIYDLISRIILLLHLLFWCFDIDNVDLQHSGPRKTFTTFIAPNLRLLLYSSHGETLDL